MIERLVAWFWKLLAHVGPQASESSSPFIAERPDEVAVPAELLGHEDEDASNPANKGKLPADLPEDR